MHNHCNAILIKIISFVYYSKKKVSFINFIIHIDHKYIINLDIFIIANAIWCMTTYFYTSECNYRNQSCTWIRRNNRNHLCVFFIKKIRHNILDWTPSFIMLLLQIWQEIRKLHFRVYWISAFLFRLST